MARTRRRGATLAALFLLASCSEPTSPVDDVRWGIQPPQMYQEFWDEVELCSGIEGSFERVDWFLTEFFPDGEDILGQWNSRHEITIRYAWRYQAYVVKHEIMHELLGGDSLHQDDAWTLCNLPVGSR